MRLIMMHKNDANTEAGKPPTMDIVTKMGAFIGGHAQAGRFIDGAGLGASKTRTRLVFREGRCTQVPGPYRGEHELPAAMLVLKVVSRDAALGWAERYGKILGDGELELGAVTEPWDLGMMPRPESPPLRFLLIEKADAATESGEGRSRKQKSDLSRLRTEMGKAGVLTAAERLLPSSAGKRLMFASNALRVIDGPFAESKELIGGFSIMRLADLDEAVELCKRYAQILGGTLEVDVRPMLEAEEGADQ